jgi:thiamine biosynthesis lipoprotein
MRILLFFIIILIFLSACGNKSAKYITNEGLIFGTTYSIIYEDINGDFHDEIKEVLLSFNKSLSAFDSMSIISRFNRGEDVIADSLFIEVFTKSVEINRVTSGAFDITIAPVINAWGFGFKKSESISDAVVDSLLQYIGIDNVYIENGIIKRKVDGVMLNASAIAKGYGVDVVSKYIKSKGINNYMVEIGGEISTSGINSKGTQWRIGIDKPVYEHSPANREFMMVLQLSGQSLATSGNYRNYFIKDGIKYGHIIDPLTGYPVQVSILSASIVANDCITADAYATACMVLVLDKSIELIESLPEIEACFIYEINGSEMFGVVYTSGFEQYILMIND